MSPIVVPLAYVFLWAYVIFKAASNVEKNREMLLQRSIVGLAKYGVTTDNNPLPLRAWLQHALEEALDMANYLQAAITKLDNEGN